MLKTRNDIVKRAVPSDPPVIAECDPSQLLRGRIRNDLNVKGLVGCPTKIDMGKIIPVYDFADNTVENFVTYQSLDFDLAGLIQQDFTIWDCNVLNATSNTEIKTEKLRMFYVRIRTDAAGRAALVAAGNEVRVYLRYLDTPTYIQVALANWKVSASVGQAWDVICGSHFTSVAPAAALSEAPNYANFNSAWPLEFKHGRGNLLNITLEIGGPGAFPLLTQSTINVIYSYK